MLAARLKRRTNQTTSQLRHTLRLFSPRTVIRWHNELVKGKGTHFHQNKGGRPRIEPDRVGLSLRLARENVGWGYGKIAGELLKLGIKLSEFTIRNVHPGYGIAPASVRAGAIGWGRPMNHYKSQILACDSLNAETLFLKALYVFFFIELGTRRAYLAGVTDCRLGPTIAQQARQYVQHLEEQEMAFRRLIRDRDRKYTDVFDTAFTSQGVHVVRTPMCL